MPCRFGRRFEGPVNLSIRICLDDDSGPFEFYVLNPYRPTEERPQVHAQLEVANLQHVGVRAPIGIGETYILRPHEDAAPKGSLELAANRECATRGAARVVLEAVLEATEIDREQNQECQGDNAGKYCGRNDNPAFLVY